jgi:uncharacterized protein involved in response to NO
MTKGSGRAPRRAYEGPAALSMGFRPFFLASALWAVLAVPLWLLVWGGRLEIGGPFGPVDWHIHEMVWGFGAAAIAGFLFTAVPNWTGRMPTQGWPLLALLGVWVLGRLGVAGALGLGPLGVAAVDCAFLLAVAGMIGREIVAGRNWRNLVVLGPVTLLLAGNVLFHWEAWAGGTADVGRRLGLGVVVFLITLIGGRIIPSFTRNWLVQRGESRLPAPVGRFDMLCLLAGGAALLLWSLWPGRVAGAGLVVAGALHLVRLSRWRGVATGRSALLLMLHVAYGFVPVGMIVTGLSGWEVVAPAAGLHLLGVGAMGGMVLAVMMRATMGHTGRELAAGPWLAAAFGGVVAAAVARAGLSQLELLGVPGLTWAGTLWVLAFGVFALRVGPWLLAPRVAGRKANR